MCKPPITPALLADTAASNFNDNKNLVWSVKRFLALSPVIMPSGDGMAKRLTPLMIIFHMSFLAKHFFFTFKVAGDTCPWINS